MVDARGVEIPYVDRDGNELKTVSERYYPAPGQKFFLKGGVIDNPKYEYRGPETLDFEELMRRRYQRRSTQTSAVCPTRSARHLGHDGRRRGQNKNSDPQKLHGAWI